MNIHNMLSRAVFAVCITAVGYMQVGQTASADDAVTTSDSRALLYVIQGSTGAFANLIVYLDGEPVGQVRAHTYLAMQIAPGTHEISTAGSSRGALTITVTAGDRYYVHQTILASGEAQLRLLSETEGQSALARSHPMDDEVRAVDASAAHGYGARETARRRAGSGGKSSGMYIGIGGGPTQVGTLNDDVEALVAYLQAINDSVYGPGVIAVSGSVDDSGLGKKLFVGYQFNNYLAMEGGYADLGEIKATINETDGIDSIDETDQWTMNCIHLAMVGQLPIGKRFSFLGKVGFINWNSEFKWTISETVTPSSVSGNEKERGVGPLAGLGARFNVTKGFGIRAEYVRYFDIGDEDVTSQFDVDEISLSTVFYF